MGHPSDGNASPSFQCTRQRNCPAQFVVGNLLTNPIQAARASTPRENVAKRPPPSCLRLIRTPGSRGAGFSRSARPARYQVFSAAIQRKCRQSSHQLKLKGARHSTAIPYHCLRELFLAHVQAAPAKGFFVLSSVGSSKSPGWWRSAELFVRLAGHFIHHTATL